MSFISYYESYKQSRRVNWWKGFWFRMGERPMKLLVMSHETFVAEAVGTFGMEPTQVAYS